MTSVEDLSQSLSDQQIADGETARSGKRHAGLLLGLLMALIIIAVLSLGIGRFPIPVDQVLDILWGKLISFAPIDGVEDRVISLVRVPRILMAILVGAGLAISGAVLQGVFRNPLVEPELIGVALGSAFGGALAILWFSSALMTVTFAFVFGLLAMLIVYALARANGHTSVLTLVLSGVVTAAFFAALVSLIKYVADPNDKLPAIVYWLMGSFAAANFEKLALVSLSLLIGGGLIMAMRYRINILSLGDEDAEALGIRVERSRWLLLIACTLIIAATVSVAGVIGWVGLVIPHITRMLVGPDHRVLIPTAGLIGAMYLIVVDDVARTATSSEIPIGIITALIGAPVFAWLLKRSQGQGWGHDQG